MSLYVETTELCLSLEIGLKLKGITILIVKEAFNS